MDANPAQPNATQLALATSIISRPAPSPVSTLQKNVYTHTMVMNNMKAVAATMLVLALVVSTSPAAVNAHRDHHHGQIWRGHHGHGHGSSSAQQGQQQHEDVLAGLTQCVTICGSGVTDCMLGCYDGPVIDVDPAVELPVCLLKCTNDAMVCASGCPLTGGGN